MAAQIEKLRVAQLQRLLRKRAPSTTSEKDLTVPDGRAVLLIGNR